MSPFLFAALGVLILWVGREVHQRRTLCRLHAAHQATEARTRAVEQQLEAAEAAAQGVEQRLQLLVQERDERELVLVREKTRVIELNQTVSMLESDRSLLERELADARFAQAARRQAEQEREAALREKAELQKRVEAGDAELTRLRAMVTRGPSRAVLGRMQELDRQIDDLNHQVEVWARRAQAAEAELARREAGQVSDAIIAERDALQARVETLEETLRKSAKTHAALSVLGIPLGPRGADMFAPERRDATQAVLRDTYIATQAIGGALLDAEGRVWARMGTATVVERLSASGALLALADAEDALGRPVQLVTETFGVYGRHFLRLPTSVCWLGLTASRETPALPLRLAMLQLIGTPPASAPRPPPAPIAVDPTRSAQLSAWTTRRRVLAAAVLGSEAAATDASFAAACLRLRALVRATYLRAARDGFGEGFTLSWRAMDDTTLTVRVLDEGKTMIFMRSDAPPSSRLLDDLVAMLRWQPSPRLTA